MKKRFQNVKFKTELNVARSYTRDPIRSRPKKGLVRVWTSRLFWYPGFVFLFVICFLYIPGYFSIYAVEVRGVDASINTIANEKTIIFLGERSSFGFPNRNLLFFNEDALKNRLTQEIPELFSVGVDKNIIGSSLSISLEKKYFTFRLLAGGRDLQLAQDAEVAKVELSPESEGSVVSVELQALEGVNGSRRQELFTEEKKAVLELREAIPKLTGLSIPSRLVFPPITITEQPKNTAAELSGDVGVVLKPATRVVDEPASEVLVYFKRSVQGSNDDDLLVKFPVGDGLGRAVEKLKVLIREKGRDYIFGLKYVDLRFENRAYLCAFNEECAREGLNLNLGKNEKDSESLGVE